MKEENFETSDIVFAAVLIEKGVEMIGIYPTKKKGKVTFSFNASVKIGEIKKKYIGGKIAVEPNSFQNAIRHLKTMAMEEI